MQEALESIGTKDKVIDIRPKNLYDKLNYPGSINIPRLKLLRDPSLYLDKNEKYYLICDTGELSYPTAKVLNALGYHCYSVMGGLDRYKKTLKK